MGRSAKFHKRQDKKKTSSAGSGSAAQPSTVPHSKPKPKPKAAPTMPTPKEQKKRAGLKEKAKASASLTRRQAGDSDGPVLGGADYVELMLGGRRKAAAEAARLPKEPDSP